jgi:hypothetical protein
MCLLPQPYIDTLPRAVATPVYSWTDEVSTAH